MICDASVLLHCDCNFHIKTVPDVLSEIKSKNSRFLLEFRDIELIEPEREFLERVETIAKRSRLSCTDKKLIALGMQLNEPIFTDDHEIQRVAAMLGLKTKNFHYNHAKTLNRLR